MKLWSGAPYDYSRSAEGLVFTAGACPLDVNGEVVAPGDVVGQAEKTVENLLAALADAGVSADSRLKTTVYVVASTRSDLALVWNVVVERAPGTLLGFSLLGSQLVEIEGIAVAGT